MRSNYKRVLLLLLLHLQSLLIMQSSCSVVLEVEESQKKMDHSIVGQKRVSSGATAAAPDPPENMQLDPESNSVVMIWYPPSDDTDLDHYYVYVEGEDMEDETTKIYYMWSNLASCTDYIFGVKSVSAEGDMSNPLVGEAETLEGIPPAPQNLQVNGFTATTVTLTWDEPDTLCYVDYRVKWSEDGASQSTSTTNETFYTVRELSKDTSYTFKVSAFTSYGDGPEATIQQTTGVHDGGPPEDLVAKGISASVISVSWSPPTLAPTYYEVTAVPCIYYVMNAFGLSYNITGLEPCDTCSITVTSVYDAGFRYTAQTWGSSLSGDTSLPNGCSVLVTDGAVTVFWDRPNISCPLEPYSVYSVNWTQTKLWGDGEETSHSEITTETKFIVLDPVPYSQYTFNVSASISGVYNSPASCSGTSLETPASAPTELMQVAMDISSVTVHWSLPVSMNGILTCWYLNWTSAIGNYLGEQFITNPEKHVLRIGGLDPSQAYIVYVMAVNGAGKGEAAFLEASTEYVP